MAELSKTALKRKLKEKAGLDYGRHVLLCAGPNCQPEIGARSVRLLKKRLRELGAHHQCRVTPVDCFTLCRSGPIALIYPEGTYYSGVTPEKCERILQEHLLGGVPVAEFAFASVPLMPRGIGSASRAAEATQMAEKTFKKGDKVEWDSAGGKSSGEVGEKVTKTAKVKGHTAKATPDEPQYRVRSDKSGKEAIHKPEELRKK